MATPLLFSNQICLVNTCHYAVLERSASSIYAQDKKATSMACVTTKNEQCNDFAHILDCMQGLI